MNGNNSGNDIELTDTERKIIRAWRAAPIATREEVIYLLRHHLPGEIDLYAPEMHVMQSDKE